MVLGEKENNRKKNIFSLHIELLSTLEDSRARVPSQFRREDVHKSENGD